LCFPFRTPTGASLVFCVFCVHCGWLLARSATLPLSRSLALPNRPHNPNPHASRPNPSCSGARANRVSE